MFIELTYEDGTKFILNTVSIEQVYESECGKHSMIVKTNGTSHLVKEPYTSIVAMLLKKEIVVANSQMKVELELIDKPRTCEVLFKYYKGDPGKYYGPPEDCYPSEPDEFDVVSITYGDVDLTCLLEVDGIEDYIIECLKEGIDDE